MIKNFNCYISYSFKPKLDVLRDILATLNVEVVNDDRELQGQSIIKYSKTLIQQSDFVIACIENDSSSVLIDIGIAEGLDKPIFIISTVNKYPDYYLKGFRFFYSDFKGSNKMLEYYLRLFLTELANKQNKTVEFEKKEVELISEIEIEATINDLYRIYKERDEAQALQKLQSVFNELGISYQNPKEITKKSYYDLILTTPKTSELIGSPVFVEIKIGKLNFSQFKSESKLLYKNFSKFPTSIGILLYLYPGESRKTKHYYLSERVFVFELVSFIENISKIGFDNFLLSERNKAAHGNI